MTLRNTASFQLRSPFRASFSIPDLRTALATGFTAAALVAATLCAHAQDSTTPAPAAAQAAAPDAAQPAVQPQNDINLSNQKPSKSHKPKETKEDKVVESKDTKKEDKKVKKDDALVGMDAKLPDKQLYDKAEDAIKHGRFDVGRLELQALLDAYPDSQYLMRAKLAVADSWYKEGGVAALTQAEQEYKDFITFFPNAPEAAEAQMRVGDIYFREMDKPDRDNTATVHAEEEYRLMLQQFPDSPLVPQARQKLREVQEVLASEEANVASFYAQRQPPNLPAAIARYQTVVDTYPLYSHMDDVLIGLGDAYEAEAKFVRALKLPEAGKARLEKIYDDEAADAYRQVVLEHAASPHVEDAKDRLVGMGLPVPTPTAEQLASSTALENSRGQYTLSKRALTFFLHQADTVPAATIGAPPLEDPTPVSAAAVVRTAISNFNTSMNPAANRAPVPALAAKAPEAAPAVATDSAPPAVAAAPVSAAPLALQDVPTASAADSTGSVVTSVPQAASPSATSGGGDSMGIEIVQPGSGSQTPAAAPATPPAFPGTANAAPAADPSQADDATGGIKAVGPPNATPLAPIEKPAVAPEVINDAAGTTQPAAQTAIGNEKPKVACDKNDESCSKHKPKKGLKKLNPF